MERPHFSGEDLRSFFPLEFYERHPYYSNPAPKDEYCSVEEAFPPYRPAETSEDAYGNSCDSFEPKPLYDCRQFKVDPSDAPVHFETEDVRSSVAVKAELDAPEPNEPAERRQDLTDQESRSRHACETCQLVCQSPAVLKIHERVHSGAKPFACSFCDYKSGQKNNVAKHLLVHMKKKPYGCQYCDYRCAQKNNLIVHERTHTGVKPFACTFCEYKTVQKPNLVKHMYLHTNEKPFACDVCDYRCVQKTNLMKHKQKHTSEKPFACTECDYKCSQKSNLQKHLLIHKKYDASDAAPPMHGCQYCPFRCVDRDDLNKHVTEKHMLKQEFVDNVNVIFENNSVKPYLDGIFNRH